MERSVTDPPAATNGPSLADPARCEDPPAPDPACVREADLDQVTTLRPPRERAVRVPRKPWRVFTLTVRGDVLNHFEGRITLDDVIADRQRPGPASETDPTFKRPDDFDDADTAVWEGEILVAILHYRGHTPGWPFTVTRLVADAGDGVDAANVTELLHGTSVVNLGTGNDASEPG